MKKLLLALPLVAGASWAGTTYYSGAQTEAAYTRLLEQLNASGNMFVLKSTAYEAGVMRSTAITEVRSTDAIDQDIHFFLEHQINHSLVSVSPGNPRFGAASIVTTLKMDDSYTDDAKDFFQLFDNGEPFVATTEVAVDGATNSEIKVNAIDHSEKDVTIKSSGASINVATTAEGNVKGDGIAESFMFSEGDDKQADMSGFAINFNMTRLENEGKVSSYLSDGEIELSLEKSEIMENAQQVASIEGVKYVVTSNLSADKPSTSANIGVNSITIDQVPLKSFDMDMVLSGFSIADIIANDAFFEELKNANNPEELIFSEKGLELIRATLQPDTKMSVKLDAVSTEGNGNAAIDLRFAGNGSDDGYTGMLTTGDLAKSIAGTAAVNVDKAAIMKTPLGGMLEQPLVQAYLNITEDKVSLNADLDQLLLKVNGQMIPLELMAGEMLQMPLEALLKM